MCVAACLFHLPTMTEKADASPLLANVCRTMPYTAYVGVSSYAVVFGSWDAAWFFVGLLVNEVMNHLAKAILKKAGPSSSLLKRPESAADTGIYPQHHPTKSTTSGMPSGHAQTSAFCAVVLTHVVWDSGAAFPLCYIWSVSLLVMVSRTRFGGILAVSVGGKRVAQHTVLQVLVGLFWSLSRKNTRGWKFESSLVMVNMRFDREPRRPEHEETKTHINRNIIFERRITSTQKLEFCFSQQVANCGDPPKVDTRFTRSGGFDLSWSNKSTLLFPSWIEELASQRNAKINVSRTEAFDFLPLRVSTLFSVFDGDDDVDGEGDDDQFVD